MKEFLKSIGLLRNNKHRSVSHSGSMIRSVDTLSRRSNGFTNFMTKIQVVMLVLLSHQFTFINARRKVDNKEGTEERNISVTTINCSDIGLTTLLADTLEGVLAGQRAKRERDEMHAAIESPEAEDFLRNITKSMNGGKSERGS